jgi:hypothetical protein
MEKMERELEKTVEERIEEVKSMKLNLQNLQTKGLFIDKKDNDDLTKLFNSFIKETTYKTRRTLYDEQKKAKITIEFHTFPKSKKSGITVEIL